MKHGFSLVLFRKWWQFCDKVDFFFFFYPGGRKNGVEPKQLMKEPFMFAG